jgi:hypothetical protein
MENTKVLKIIVTACFVFVLLALPYVAQLSTADEIGADYDGASFVWTMFPSWIYVGGAIVMLILGLKSLSGGSLAKPFTLMGLTLLLDALAQMVSSLVLISLIPRMEIIDRVTFGVELIFRLSIVFSMVWIANIFGVLKMSKPKPAPVATTTAPPAAPTTNP